MPPAGSDHGAIIANFTIILGQFVKKHNLGVAFGTKTGFQLATDSDTVRVSDFVFVRRDRIPESGIPQNFGLVLQIWLWKPSRLQTPILRLRKKCMIGLMRAHT